MQGEIIVCQGEYDVARVLRACGVEEDGLQVTVCATERQLADRLTEWKRCAPYFVVKQREGRRLLRRGEIVCVQAVGHRFSVHMADGEEVLSTTKRCAFPRSMEPLLQESRFLQCSASAVVNLDYVQGYRDARLVLKNGETLLFPAKWRRRAEAELGRLGWSPEED